MDEIQKVLVKAGRKDLAQKYYLKVTSLSDLVFNLDKWMPEDWNLQQEFSEIHGSDKPETEKIKEMIDFLKEHADQEVMVRYGFQGNWEYLAKQIIKQG